MRRANARGDRPRWLQRVFGESSQLRVTVSVSGYGMTYSLDSSRVDVTKARQLYDNTDNKYKLGAGFARPVVNSAVGFMGVPQFRSEDEEAQLVLDAFFGSNASKCQRVHRNALRDGDCYVLVTREEAEPDLYPEAPARLQFNIILADQVYDIRQDPLTGQDRAYVLRSSQTWKDDRDGQHSATIEITYTAESIERKLIQGDLPDGFVPGVEANVWGFIPIVHFKNESDETKKWGISDLEAIEPFLKAYHDVMVHAIQGSQMHSTPRLKMKVKDVRSFLKNNFGIDDPVAFAKSGERLRFEGREAIILNSAEDDVDFVEVSSATGAAGEVLKFLFWCIVDASETPEFAFGVHTPSSLSSVREQMPVLVRRVSRKRDHFSESWQRLARIVLGMTARANGTSFPTYDTALDWDEIDPRSETDVADSLLKTVQALAAALDKGLISQEASAQFLAGLIETMNDYLSDDPEIPGEREKILRDSIIRRRIEEGDLVETDLRAIRSMLDSGLPSSGSSPTPPPSTPPAQEMTGRSVRSRRRSRRRG